MMTSDGRVQSIPLGAAAISHSLNPANQQCKVYIPEIMRPNSPSRRLQWEKRAREGTADEITAFPGQCFCCQFAAGIPRRPIGGSLRFFRDRAECFGSP